MQHQADHTRKAVGLIWQQSMHLFFLRLKLIHMHADSICLCSRLATGLSCFSKDRSYSDTAQTRHADHCGCLASRALVVQGSVLKALVRAYGPRLALCGLLQITYNTLQLAAPLLLQQLLIAVRTDASKGAAASA